MIPFRSCFAQVYLILFASFALAALQNVTVDDAVLIGPVIPQYLPSMYYWDIGNACNGCLISPDPSMAYNGTWHDSYYSPATGVAQKISFNFTGSALYIFFIMANNITGAATLTNIEFVLDGVAVGQYTHTPLATTDYQYNVPVYANGGMTSGEHAMTIQPANSQSNMLMLFDYLIYSTDTSSSVSPSVQATSTLPSTSAMSTSSGTQGTSPKQNIGAIVGGTVGSIAALVLIAASLSCYRRHKRHVAGRPPLDEGVVDPFISSREVAPTSLIGTTSSTGLVGSPFAKHTSRANPSITSPQPSIPPATTTASSSSDARPGNDPGLHGQVELLWGEVARLRNLQHLDRNSVELRSEAPPEYS